MGVATEWNSQPSLSDRKNNCCGVGDFELASSTVLCGATYVLLQSISSCMELSMFSHTTYDKIQRAYVAPVVFSAWNAQKSALIRELMKKNDR